MKHLPSNMAIAEESSSLNFSTVQYSKNCTLYTVQYILYTAHCTVCKEGYKGATGQDDELGEWCRIIMGNTNWKEGMEGGDEDCRGIRAGGKETTMGY